MNFDNCDLTELKLRNALTNALSKVDNLLLKFSDGFPKSSSCGGIYPSSGNTDWTQCFWTGILWLSYELTKNSKYLYTVTGLMDSFKERIDKRIALHNHDIGFIFILSTLAGYKVTGDSELRQKSLDAAMHLANRFREKGQFIQLTGEADCEDPASYRLIIDCLMNINLLYWAGEETGDAEFTRRAYAHFKSTVNNVIRPDGSTFQNCTFDKTNGDVVKLWNRQGRDDESCWSRGQAWGVLGIPLTYAYMKNEDIIDTYYKVADYFLDNLPEDKIAYWDHCYTNGSEPRDSSASAIAVCGLLQACSTMPIDEAHRAKYIGAAVEIMNSLIDNYSNTASDSAEGLISHGTYWYGGDLGIDECTIWGDYFYLEAIMRFLNPEWKKYW